MMLTILGLPPTTKYRDLKVLIKTRCNLNDFILDDLVSDTNGLKKVRIGLADANEGAHLMKCLAGFRMAGCVLSVTPVGKTPMPAPQQNQNFSQPQNDYQGNDYNEPRPSPWGQQPQNPPQNQWTPNPMGQAPQNTFGYQQQPPMQNNQYIPPQQHQNQMQHHNQPQNLHPNQNQTQHQTQNHVPSHQSMHQPQPMQRPDLKPFPQREAFPGSRPEQYGFQGKSNMAEPPPQRSHVLRTVEIIDTPINRPAVPPIRYPGQGYTPQDKPMTILKDNFQGPSPYNLGQAAGTQGPAQPWMQQQQQQKPPAFADPKRPPIKPQAPDRGFKDYDKDFEPLSPVRETRKSPFRKTSPGRRVSPRGSPRRGSPSRRSPRRGSPSRRSPRRGSPPGRRSPGRRASPGHRPHDHDRRSPGRMAAAMDAPGRAWTARRPSPGKRSPERRPDPASLRYSPSRRLADKPDEFLDRPGNKPVRPAYEPSTQAANQAYIPGGYRAGHEKPYPPPARPVESPWQQERDKAMFNEVLKKREEERNAPRMPFERPGIGKEQRAHSPRKSRSPLRRDKSPSRDRFKRHSPSPRSPRRSWALEKRRSPDLGDAPPPPIWPGQINREEKRPDFDDVEAKRKPVWEYKKDLLDARRPDEDRRFPAPEGIRVRRDLGPPAAPEHREELDFKRDDRFPREVPKFNPREDFDKKVPKFSPRDDFEKKIPPKFSPRDDFEKKGPKFSPRDDFDKRPKFSPREEFVKVPKFSPRDDYQEPKFSRDEMMRKDPKFSHDFERPKFSPRDDYEDRPERRDEFRKLDLSDWKPREVPLKPPPERDVYRPDFPPKRDEPSRIELRRDVLRKMSEELDKQFEDVHKRAQDFHKRAEEFRRDDRRRDYDREPAPKPYEDRHREEDRGFRYEERRKEDWNTDEHLKNKAIMVAAIKAKKEKASEEIAQKILDKHNIDAEAPQNVRICEELKVSVGRIINEMFGDSDVSFIELVIKFNAKYSGAGEDKILRDVMASFPSQFRPKRSAPGKRPFSPGARQRGVRNDGFREKKAIPSPVKKPRVETHPYHEPERRPMAKPAHKIPELKVTPPAVIEKKPVLFNPASASVSEYPPLPQRKPVQRQQPTPVPQKPEPKTVPQKPEPKIAQKPEPKTVPQRQEPKAVQKPTVQKQEVKPVAKQPAKPVAQNTEPKVVAENNVKPVETRAPEPKVDLSAQPTTNGVSQLNSLASRILDDEIQQIMTKVFLELPKEPSGDAERLVVNKFKTVAGDDIKNALGLNVTKRLLNKHNPLYVKLVFSGKPESGCLQAFIAARRISAFKRIDSPSDTFAARLDDVADFDTLCSAKEVTCGSAKVAVTPCYKFLGCPPTIKTIYAPAAETKDKPDTTPNSSPLKQKNADKTDNSVAKIADVNNKVPPKDNNPKEVKKSEISETKDISDKKVEVKTVTPVNNTKMVPDSPVKVNITIQAQTNANEAKKSEVTKPETKKETANKSEGTKVNQKNDVKKTVKNDSMEEMMVVDEHIDDEVEMNDQDILALMSGGIVLDEWSGSEDEK